MMQNDGCTRWDRARSPFLVVALLTLLLPLAGPRVAEAKNRATPPRLDGLLNLNEATVEQLCLLPGVGPGKARAIVRYRERHRFGWVGQLRRIKGFGPKTFLRLRPYLRVEGPTTLALAGPGADGAQAAPPAPPGDPPRPATPAPVDLPAPTAAYFPLSVGLSTQLASPRSMAVVAALGNGPVPRLSAPLPERSLASPALRPSAALDPGRATSDPAAQPGDDRPGPLRWSEMPASLGPVLRLPFPLP